MRHFYDNIYYRLYLFIRSLGEESIPRYNAVLLMSIFSILNVLTILGFLMILFNEIIVADLPKVYLLLLGFAVIGINSYLIFGRKRYLAIEQRFSNEDRADQTRNRIYAMIYILVTIGLLLLLLVYLNDHPITKDN